MHAGLKRIGNVLSMLSISRTDVLEHLGMDTSVQAGYIPVSDNRVIV